jgi:hypothetical protein
MAMLSLLVTWSYAVDDHTGHGWVVTVNWALVAAILVWGYVRRERP